MRSGEFPAETGNWQWAIDNNWEIKKVCYGSKERKRNKSVQVGFELSMEVFKITKFFPNEEKYALISETSGWLDFSLACEYIDEDTFNRLSAKMKKSDVC